MTRTDQSLSIANPIAHRLKTSQKISLAIAGIGILILFVAIGGVTFANPTLYLALSIGLITVGTLLFTHQTYAHLPAGIKNNGVWFDSLTSKGALGWISGIIITGFYVLLYWFPALLGLGADGAANTGIVALFDPLSYFFKGQPASQWFVYGTLYTVAILVLGYKFIWKYRHNRYQIIRTISVMFFQLAFAFILPEILQDLNYPYNDFKNMWPLNYYFFDEWSIKGMLNSGTVGVFMLFWGIAMIFLVSPFLTYFYGKRWYCSWVCGCGGLAETAGDPFRHLSDKSLNAWQIERWVIHAVLFLATLMTVAVLYSFAHNNPEGFWLTKGVVLGLTVLILGFVGGIAYFKPDYFNTLDKKVKPYVAGAAGFIVVLLAIAFFTGSDKGALFIDSYSLRSWYGFLIGAAFSGVVGVGFYPLMGSRVWCRFGCPMAAILGLQQKFFSRFRITTNGGQCISCGNCSTYCEMGIDVRSYAQKGQDVVRASCVGCGICAAVCPRGVLRLENSAMDVDTRTEDLRTLHITEDGIAIPDMIEDKYALR